MIDELAHHLRQAEVDLGLARSQVGLALSRSTNGEGQQLRLIAMTLELVETSLRVMRVNRGLEDDIQPAPRSSER